MFHLSQTAKLPSCPHTYRVDKVLQIQHSHVRAMFCSVFLKQYHLNCLCIPSTKLQTKKLQLQVKPRSLCCHIKLRKLCQRTRGSLLKNFPVYG